ncbi:hypothetical protein B0H10DRAFT_2428271 [Mycena sp. CBHHK59/15]|nr:hypothetical protein B0H10DRAFT_2428271 [Mycena sp. CBHHK59/15]
MAHQHRAFAGISGKCAMDNLLPARSVMLRSCGIFLANNVKLYAILPIYPPLDSEADRRLARNTSSGTLGANAGGSAQSASRGRRGHPLPLALPRLRPPATGRASRMLSRERYLPTRARRREGRVESSPQRWQNPHTTGLGMGRGRGNATAGVLAKLPARHGSSAATERTTTRTRQDARKRRSARDAHPLRRARSPSPASTASSTARATRPTLRLPAPAPATADATSSASMHGAVDAGDTRWRSSEVRLRALRGLMPVSGQTRAERTHLQECERGVPSSSPIWRVSAVCAGPSPADSAVERAPSMPRVCHARERWSCPGAVSEHALLPTCARPRGRTDSRAKATQRYGSPSHLALG